MIVGGKRIVNKVLVTEQLANWFSGQNASHEKRLTFLGINHPI